MKKVAISAVLMTALAVSVWYVMTQTNWIFPEHEPVLINDEIEEASGIVYHPERNTLFVVEDEGTVYELSLTGTILREADIGDFDLEGITLGVTSGELSLAIEGIDSILTLTVDDLLVQSVKPIKRTYRGSLFLHEDASKGVEGIHRTATGLWVVNQSYNTDASDLTDQSALFKAEIAPRNRHYRIAEVLPLPITDMAGLTEYDDVLYILSDDENLITKVRLSDMTIVDSFSTPVSGEQEGITFDQAGNMYLAVESSGIYRIEQQ